MQNELDNGKTLYVEQSDISGFIIREVNTPNYRFRFQAGHHVSRPMSIPIYSDDNKITHHRLGDDIQSFNLEGYGKTREEAIDNASTNLLRLEIQASKRA